MSLRTRVDALERWLQREEDTLLYTPDAPLSSPYFPQQAGQQVLVTSCMVACPVPCPFCDHVGALSRALAAGIFSVVCGRCAAHGPWARTLEEAIATWTASNGERGWQVCPSCVHHWLEHRPPAQERSDVLCPFCGIAASRVQVVTVGCVMLCCGVCHAQGPYTQSVEDAQAAWAASTIFPRRWISCAFCSKGFVRSRATQQYCTLACRDRASAVRRQQRREMCAS